MKFSMKTLALTLGLLAKMNTFANAEKDKINIKKAAKTEISELKSSGQWPNGASASTIAYLTNIGQWPLKTSEGKNTVASTRTPPANDSCASATEITSFPFSSSGDTSAASYENGVALPTCGDNVRYYNARAVWYKVTGTGEVMDAKTVIPDGIDFDTVLHVYSGSCGAFTCVDGNDDSGARTLSKVRWLSIAGVEYYILVFGFESEDYGPYKLKVTVPVPSPNDVCADASEIPSLPFSSSGDTSLASIETGVALPTCGYTSIYGDVDYDESPAVWY